MVLGDELLGLIDHGGGGRGGRSNLVMVVVVVLVILVIILLGGTGLGGGLDFRNHLAVGLAGFGGGVNHAHGLLVTGQAAVSSGVLVAGAFRDVGVGHGVVVVAGSCSALVNKTVGVLASGVGVFGSVLCGGSAMSMVAVVVVLVAIGRFMTGQTAVSVHNLDVAAQCISLALGDVLATDSALVLPLGGLASVDLAIGLAASLEELDNTALGFLLAIGNVCGGDSELVICLGDFITAVAHRVGDGHESCGMHDTGHVCLIEIKNDVQI